MSPTVFLVCGYSLYVESSRRLEELMSVGSGVSWGPEEGSNSKQQGGHA